MCKEFHWFESDEELIYSSFNNNYIIPVMVGFSYKDTLDEFNQQTDIIFSTQSHFVNQQTLDKGYKIFIHFYHCPAFTLDRGECEATTRYISPVYNLEKMLFSGEFNKWREEHEIVE